MDSPLTKQNNSSIIRAQLLSESKLYMNSYNSLLTLAGLAWFGLMALLISSEPSTSPIVTTVPTPKAMLEEKAGPSTPRDILPPYSNYDLTQGPHGLSYGHYAIDLTGGKGASLLSPIEGKITQNDVDGIGNTTLVIENEHYQVTLLHGVYSVGIGDSVKQGQIIGYEWNNGNTVDYQGRSCRGRDCGYHTHLNIYDKNLGININPLDWIPSDSP
jgi:murein DD-endopeptidase MepM/ murein hydrolase activator NlpD